MPRDITRRDSREIAPGVWRDPISERRHDYDGAQAGFEFEILKLKAFGDAMPGGGNQDFLNTVWDSALEIAAHIVETEPSDGHTRERMAAKIRALKKEK